MNPIVAAHVAELREIAGDVVVLEVDEAGDALIQVHGDPGPLVMSVSAANIAQACHVAERAAGEPEPADPQVREASDTAYRMVVHRDDVGRITYADIYPIAAPNL